MAAPDQIAPPLMGGAAPDQARLGLVLVHGRGGTARDILGLGAALGRSDIAFAAPEAPGNSWWPTSFLAPTAQMAPFVTAGIAAIDHAIDALVAAGLPRDRVALAGFSQGACLALEYGARRGGLLALGAIAGGLVGTGDAEDTPDPALYGFTPKRLDYDTDLAGLALYLSVHEQDPHIPLARSRDSLAVFKTLGATGDLRVKPGAGHGIDQADIDALGAILPS